MCRRKNIYRWNVQSLSRPICTATCYLHHARNRRQVKVHSSTLFTPSIQIWALLSSLFCSSFFHTSEWLQYSAPAHTMHWDPEVPNFFWGQKKVPKWGTCVVGELLCTFFCVFLSWYLAIGIINADFVRSTNNKILRRVVSCYRWSLQSDTTYWYYRFRNCRYSLNGMSSAANSLQYVKQNTS